jgi:hypothetical protein
LRAVDLSANLAEGSGREDTPPPITVSTTSASMVSFGFGSSSAGEGSQSRPASRINPGQHGAQQERVVVGEVPDECLFQQWDLGAHPSPSGLR